MIGAIELYSHGQGLTSSRARGGGARHSTLRVALLAAIVLLVALGTADLAAGGLLAQRLRATGSSRPVAALPAPGAAAGLTVALEPVASGLRAPLAVTAAGDGSGRLFVVEKAGTIRIVRDGVVLPTPFLDITPLVRSRESERGLLGLAFHPRYVENGYFFVNYTDQNGDTVVARYQATGDPDVADPATGTVILYQPQPYANHNGGALVFGPDGYLWIGLGDGGSAGDPQNNAQNRLTFLGKMLRLDVDSAFPYLSPPDNPLIADPNAYPEIWAYGLRNPWRYSFDRLTGDLWLPDVGQDQWEEVNVVPAGTGAGANFGWSMMEGADCYNGSGCNPDGLVLPVAQYGHDLGCSITGGYVYRGASHPSLYGAYLYGDFCSGRIWTLAQSPDGAWVPAEALKADVQISSFGEDESGEVYVTGLGNGTLYRITVP